MNILTSSSMLFLLFSQGKILDAQVVIAANNMSGIINLVVDDNFAYYDNRIELTSDNYIYYSNYTVQYKKAIQVVFVCNWSNYSTCYIISQLPKITLHWNSDKINLNQVGTGEQAIFLNTDKNRFRIATICLSIVVAIMFFALVFTAKSRLKMKRSALKLASIIKKLKVQNSIPEVQKAPKFPNMVL